MASSVVLLIAFLKARLIGLDFMELRSAPPLLRLMFEAWAVAACAGLLARYWLSPAASHGKLVIDVADLGRPQGGLERGR